MEPYIHALEAVNNELGDLRLIAQRLCNTLNNKGRIFVAGNGGSHSIAQHFSCDLMKAVGSDKLDCHVTCLSDNTAMMTAIANDIGYEDVFSKQVEEIDLGIHDTVIAFSVSGSSPNIVLLLRTAHEHGATIYLIRGVGDTLSGSWLGRHWLTVEVGGESSHHLHYYAVEVAFSAMAHEIARLFHIRMGNYA